MHKGISAILVAIFLTIISVSLAYGFLIWSQSAQQNVQEEIEGGAERQVAELNAGLSIVAVADNQISVKNTGRNILETEKIDVLLDGRRVPSVADVATLGPGNIAVINVTYFLPGLRKIRVTGPLSVGDETTEAVLYPGTVAFWDFAPEDEGTPQDSSAGGNDGVLNGTTRLALHFDESRGDIAPDSSGYKNDAILNNGARWVSGITRSGVNFDGSDDFASTVDTPDLSVTGALTLEAWVRTTSTAAKQFIVGKDNSNQRSYLLMVHTNKLTLNILQTADGSVGQAVQDSVTNRVADGQWHHVVGTYSPSEQMVLYVDGEEVASTTTSVPSSIFDSTANLEIGRRSFVGNHIPFKGDIDEVAVHAYVLSASEVKTHYTSKKVLFSDYVKGIHNSALVASNSSVRVPSSNSLDVFSAATIETWINARGGSTDNDTLLIKDGSYALFFNATGNQPWARFWLQGGAVADTYFRPAASITRNNWHHVAATADGSTVIVYVDGQESSRIGYDGLISFTDSPLLIGARASGANAFNGTMDYVAVYKGALTADEIRAIHEAGVD